VKRRINKAKLKRCVRIKNVKAKDHEKKIFTMKEDKCFQETIHFSRRFFLPFYFQYNSNTKTYPYPTATPL